MTTTTKHFRVTGVVQGVSFRAATQQQAQALKLRGWVRNCSDGAVELVAQGTAAELGRLEQWLHKGPRAARVDSVEARVVEQGNSEVLGEVFGIRH